MQRVFDTVVDRTRSRLDVPKIRTIFGTAQRPRRTRKHSSVIEAAIETPTFDLTVFQLHFGRLVQCGVGDLHLRLHAGGTNHPAARGAAGQVIHQGRLAHAGIAMQHQHAALTRPYVAAPRREVCVRRCG
jgi:hypothetical protein